MPFCIVNGDSFVRGMSVVILTVWISANLHYGAQMRPESESSSIDSSIILSFFGLPYLCSYVSLLLLPNLLWAQQGDAQSHGNPSDMQQGYRGDT